MRNEQLRPAHVDASLASPRAEDDPDCRLLSLPLVDLSQDVFNRFEFLAGFHDCLDAVAGVLRAVANTDERFLGFGHEV